MSRIIQVPIDEPLLESLDSLAATQHVPRAALIREACRRYVAAAESRRLDDVYEAGYRRVPEDGSIGDSQVAVLDEVLDRETW